MINNGYVTPAECSVRNCDYPMSIVMVENAVLAATASTRTMRNMVHLNVDVITCWTRNNAQTLFVSDGPQHRATNRCGQRTDLLTLLHSM